MNFNPTMQEDPHYDDRCHMCWNCNEPLVLGFTHVCGLAHEIDDFVEAYSENSKTPLGEAT